MAELSVNGQRLDALARHFIDTGVDYLEPYLRLLGGTLDPGESRYRDYGSLIDEGELSPIGQEPPPPPDPTIVPVSPSDGFFAGLRAHNDFFEGLGSRRGTFAKASPVEFGGNDNGFAAPPAPWAAKLAADWNTAVDARATDMARVIREVYKLADVLITAVEDYENVDIYNADGIRQTTD